MKYNEKELGKFRRKAPLYKIIEEIESNGIKIKYKKYPEFHTMAILRNIVLDYQDLVPGDEPDLSELTDAVDIVDVVADFDGLDWKSGTDDLVIKEAEQTEPDWELIKTIDVTDPRSDEGRGRIVRAVYLELLFRDPDPSGMQSYKTHLRDGLSISNIRDAIRRSKEYKKLHKIV